MKKSLFHKGFYRELLRQLRTAGVVSASILTVLQTGIFLAMLVSSESSPAMPSAYIMAASPMLYAYVMGITLTFIAFNWLNSRRGSDFYHSLPVSRNAVYLSTVAAVMTWLLIGLAVSGVINVVLYAAFRLPYNMLLYGMVMLFAAASSLVTVGAVSIACSLCGTRFVNFAAALVILFMPRMLLSIFGGFIALRSNGALRVWTLCWLFDPTFNVAGSFPYAPIFGGIDYTRLGALVYNFAYGIALTLLGLSVFKKRRSEDAGIPTTSKLFQAVVRCSFGMPLLLVLAYLLLDGQNKWLPIVLLVVFAFIFYCLYELISTKSLKRTAKAMPLFLVCIGVMLLCVVLAPAVAKAELELEIPAEDIKAYYIASSDDTAYYVGLLDGIFGYSTNTYSDVMLKRLRFDDEASIRIIAEGYAQARLSNLGRASYAMYQSDREAYSNIWVRIDRKFGRDVVRCISIPESKLYELESIWSRREDYQSFSSGFPEGKLWFAVEGLTESESRAVAEAYAEDYNKLTESERQSLCASNGGSRFYNSPIGYYFGTPLAMIQFVGCRGLEHFEGRYRVSELTPNAAALYIKIINDKAFDEGMSLLRDMAKADGAWPYTVMLRVPTSEQPESIEWEEGYYVNDGWLYLDAYNCIDGNHPAAKLYSEVRDLLVTGARAESPENCVVVTISTYSLLDGDRVFALTLSESDMQRLRELIGEINVIEYGYVLGEIVYPEVDTYSPED